MSKYLDWGKIFSYKADVTMVISERGFGKTYGLRKQFVKDYLKYGARFVEFTRYKNEIGPVSKDYFGKLQENNEFPEYIFKTDNLYAYIAKKPDGDKVKADDWHIMGYFVPLSTTLTVKKMTFVNVYRMVMDEAIIDKRISPYSRYLKNEFETLNNAIDSVTRERADDENRQRPKLYLLGNACDMLNPYFLAFHINKVPEHGFTWFANKMFLLAYPKNIDYARRKRKETLAGRLSDMTYQRYSAIENEFSTGSTALLAKKPSTARLEWGWVWKGQALSVWDDVEHSGVVYICKGMPKNSGAPFFSISTADNDINLRVAERGERHFIYIKLLYNEGMLRYQDAQTRNIFFETMKVFGVRSC